MKGLEHHRPLSLSSPRSETLPTSATRYPWRHPVYTAGRHPHSTVWNSRRSLLGWLCVGSWMAGCCELGAWALDPALGRQAQGGSLAPGATWRAQTCLQVGQLHPPALGCYQLQSHHGEPSCQGLLSLPDHKHVPTETHLERSPGLGVAPISAVRTLLCLDHLGQNFSNRGKPWMSPKRCVVVSGDGLVATATLSLAPHGLTAHHEGHQPERRGRDPLHCFIYSLNASFTVCQQIFINSLHNQKTQKSRC